MNGRLFVGNDVSLNGNVYVGEDLTINGNINVQQYTGNSIIKTTSTTYSFIVGEDISLNGRLFANGDISLNSRLFVGADTIISGRLYVGSDLSVNGRIFANYAVGSIPVSAVVGGLTTAISVNTYINDVSMTGNLFVGRNLLVGVSAAYFPLDVSGTVNFRGVVNPFQLPDGSVLATAALPIDYVNGFGVTWNIAANTPATLNWKSCAISANGQTQIACVTNGSIYTSLNYGVFWTKSNASNLNWTSIAMASSGQYQAASVSTGYIFTSTNFGVFWTQQTNSG
jgi:hypothetical protein